MKSYLIQFTELKVSRFIEAFGYETKAGKHYFHLVEDHSDWETFFDVKEVLTIIESAEPEEKTGDETAKARPPKPAGNPRSAKRRAVHAPAGDKKSVTAD